MGADRNRQEGKETKVSRLFKKRRKRSPAGVDGSKALARGGKEAQKFRRKEANKTGVGGRRWTLALVRTSVEDKCWTVHPFPGRQNITGSKVSAEVKSANYTVTFSLYILQLVTSVFVSAAPSNNNRVQKIAIIV